MESNPNFLVFHLRSIQRRNSVDQFFIPELSLFQVMTRDAIRKTLQDAGTELYKLDKMVEHISRYGIKIFAILVLTYQIDSAYSFVEAELSDGHLPFSSVPLDNALSLPSFRHFYEMQWKFTAPTFYRSTINRNFHAQTVLPFIEEKLIGGSSFSKVYEIKLDSCHQQLEGPFRHRV